MDGLIQDANQSEDMKQDGLKQIRRVDVRPSEFEVLLVEEFRMSGLACMFSTWFKLTENSLWAETTAHLVIRIVEGSSR